MSNNVVTSGPIVDAVLALLREELPETVLLGDGASPDAGSLDRLDLSYGFANVYYVPGGPRVAPSWTGSAAAMRQVRLQVSAFGIQANQARWISDRCQEILLGHDDDTGWIYDLDPTGISVINRRLAIELPPDVSLGAYMAGFGFDLLVSADPD